MFLRSVVIFKNNLFQRYNELVSSFDISTTFQCELNMVYEICKLLRFCFILPFTP